MNKIGLNLARMSWPIDYYGEGLTHSETCYTHHDACAIHRLADEVEMLRGAIAEWARADRGSNQARWAKAHNRLQMIADEIKDPQ